MPLLARFTVAILAVSLVSFSSRAEGLSDFIARLQADLDGNQTATTLSTHLSDVHGPVSDVIRRFKPTDGDIGGKVQVLSARGLQADISIDFHFQPHTDTPREYRGRGRYRIAQADAASPWHFEAEAPLLDYRKEGRLLISAFINAQRLRDLETLESQFRPADAATQSWLDAPGNAWFRKALSDRQRIPVTATQTIGFPQSIVLVNLLDRQEHLLYVHGSTLDGAVKVWLAGDMPAPTTSPLQIPDLFQAIARADFCAVMQPEAQTNPTGGSGYFVVQQALSKSATETAPADITGRRVFLTQDDDRTNPPQARLLVPMHVGKDGELYPIYCERSGHPTVTGMADVDLRSTVANIASAATPKAMNKVADQILGSAKQSALHRSALVWMTYFSSPILLACHKDATFEVWRARYLNEAYSIEARQYVFSEMCERLAGDPVNDAKMKVLLQDGMANPAFLPIVRLVTLKLDPTLLASTGLADDMISAKKELAPGAWQAKGPAHALEALNKWPKLATDATFMAEMAAHVDLAKIDVKNPQSVDLLSRIVPSLVLTKEGRESLTTFAGKGNPQAATLALCLASKPPKEARDIMLALVKGDHAEWTMGIKSAVLPALCGLQDPEGYRLTATMAREFAAKQSEEPYKSMVIPMFLNSMSAVADQPFRRLLECQDWLAARIAATPH